MFLIEGKAKELWAVELTATFFLWLTHAFALYEVGGLSLTALWHVGANLILWCGRNVLAHAFLEIWDFVTTAWWHIRAHFIIRITVKLGLDFLTLAGVKVWHETVSAWWHF